MRPCDHDSRPLYERLIGPMREAAARCGYALAVHGTLKRDIDLIACPWAEWAVSAVEVAEAIRAAAAEHNGGVAFQSGREVEDRYHRLGQPGGKPWGRRCWSFHLGGGPYIDLSVMPREYRESDEPYVLDNLPGDGVTA